MPLVSIECVSCRERNLYSIGSSTHIKLVGGCSNCGLFSTHYYWNAERDDGTPLLLDANTTRTGNKKPSLSIRQGILTDGHSYRFSLNITSDLFKSWGFAMIELEAGKPPSGGQCELTLPDSGFVETLHDALSVNCTGWSSHLLLSMLTYHVYVRSMDPTAAAAMGGQTWYPIYRGTSSHITFRIAAFDDGLDKVEVVVEIIDKSRAMQTALEQYVEH